MSLILSSRRKDEGDSKHRTMRVYRRLDSTSTKADNPTVSPALIPSLSGPGGCVCNSCYNTIIWRDESRTHLSKQARPSTEHSRKAWRVICLKHIYFSKHFCYCSGLILA